MMSMLDLVAIGVEIQRIISGFSLEKVHLVDSYDILNGITTNFQSS